MAQQFAPLICPFCKKEFALPEEYDGWHDSSCGCGAKFALGLAEDAYLDHANIRDTHGEDAEIRTVENVDDWGEGVPAQVDAHFFRPSGQAVT